MRTSAAVARRAARKPLLGRSRPGAALLAAALAAVAALSLAPAALAAGDPNQVTVTLEGCRNNGGVTLPDAQGNFVCADTAYTTGNLGKGWNELDLVPFRTTTQVGNQANATTTYSIAFALDNVNSGRTGYDVISAPVVNTAESHASCQITSTLQQGDGGTSIYRIVTITQDKGTTCVFDWYGRLAIGASNYPGASLHANLFNQNLGTQGVGQKDVSIPVKEILPQQLRKDMAATQDSDHAWTVKKGATPATAEIPDTCAPNANLSVPVSITLEWEILPAAGSGNVTVVTHVYAKNPASRAIDVSVQDQIRSGTAVKETSGYDAFETVAANTEKLVMTHSMSMPAAEAVDLNDVATAKYRDTVTQIDIPQTTTATASATVQPSGVELNKTATISDSETISGTGFSYSVNGVTGVTGSFAQIYTFPTTGQVDWSSGTQSGNASSTFSKTVFAAAGVSGNATLADTATLNGSDGFTAQASASTTIRASRLVTLTISKTISGGLFATDQKFTFEVKGALGSSKTVEVMVPAGKTSASVDVTGLAPDTYTVTEQQRTGFGPVQTPDPVDLTTGCSGSVSVTNSFAPPTAAAKKTTQPAGSEAGWEMVLTDVTDAQNPVVIQKVTTDANGDGPFTEDLLDGHSYTITETPQNGWDAHTPTGDCAFTVKFPDDADKEFVCSFTNVKRGSITVVKQTVPDGSAATFGFTGELAGSIGDGQSLTKSVAPGDYGVSESAKGGWDLTGIVCDDGNSTGNTATRTASFKVGAGENVTCTFTNTQRGAINVVKQTVPDGSTATFDFTGDASGTISDNGSIQVFNLAPGTYTSTESAKDGWDLTDLACDDGGSATKSTVDKAARTATFKVDPGETVTCTFTNTQRGQIRVVKQTNPDGSTAQFDFTGDLSGTIGDGESIPGTGYKEVVPGNYSVTESAKDGWDLTGLSCVADQGSGGSTTVSPSARTASINVQPGAVITCTFTNRQRGTIKLVKQTDPSNSTATFTFSGDLSGTIGNNESIPTPNAKEVIPGTYTATEAAKDGWDLTKISCSDPTGNSTGDLTARKATFSVQPGEDVVCTFTNRERGRAKVVKTVAGAAPNGTQAFTFQLRKGATTTASGTTLETQVANAANGGLISFAEHLVPGETYQMCEIVMPAWLTSLGTFVPDSFYPPDGQVPNPMVDNSILCVNFTVSAGETKVFTVDNTPPPGGRALTIGFWKNWSSCSGGRQKAVLDQTLAKAEPGGILVGDLILHGSTVTPDKAPDCLKAVRLLDKSTIDTGKKMASDPIFNLAAQYLAAQLNVTAGAGTNPYVLCNIASAQALMDAVNFNGKTHLKLTTAQSTKANELAKLLDDYNNNRSVTYCVA